MVLCFVKNYVNQKLEIRRIVNTLHDHSIETG